MYIIYMTYTYTKKENYAYLDAKYTNTRLCVYIYIYIQTYRNVSTYIHTHIHACIHAFIRTNIYNHAYIHIYKYVYMYALIYLFIYSRMGLYLLLQLHAENMCFVLHIHVHSLVYIFGVDHT